MAVRKVISIIKRKTWIAQKVCENKDFCNVDKSNEDTNRILEVNQNQKSDKAPFIIYYSDLKCIIGKNDGCKKIQKVHLQQK